MADTDGDGLTDGDEAGDADTGGQETVFTGFSDPRLPDTDSDGLSDAGEADNSLDPYDPDSDDDGVDDGREVTVLGTAPDATDTDGDGFNDGYEDANRETQGLDPLWPDVPVSKWTYASDFAKGAIAGDLWREDTLAWLAGNLTAGASSSIPVVGTVVGAITDVRDAVGSAIHDDWVGAGFSAAGVVPGGDAFAVPGKAAKFITRNPALAPDALAIIARTSWIPDAIKADAARLTQPGWDRLLSTGTSEQALLRLQQGRVSIDRLADAIRRPSHVAGVAAPFMRDGPAGERFLERQLGAAARGEDLQVRFPTRGCDVGCPSTARISDVYVDGVAHESKVGAVSLTRAVEAQIRADAWLIRTGEIQAAHWHFFASSTSNSISPNEPVLDLLDELRIPYTIHLPPGS